MLPGIVYEYYASNSFLEPKYIYVLKEHKAKFFAESLYPGTNQYEYDYTTLAEQFFTLESGLTPMDEFTLQEHVEAYFANLGLPAPWEMLLYEDIMGELFILVGYGEGGYGEGGYGGLTNI